MNLQLISSTLLNLKMYIICYVILVDIMCCHCFTSQPGAQVTEVTTCVKKWLCNAEGLLVKSLLFTVVNRHVSAHGLHQSAPQNTWKISRKQKDESRRPTGAVIGRTRPGARGATRGFYGWVHRRIFIQVATGGVILDRAWQDVQKCRWKKCFKGYQRS